MDDEIISTINTLKTNKSTSEDGLAAELFKYDGKELICEIRNLIRDF
jgi:hypothetical protein